MQNKIFTLHQAVLLMQGFSPVTQACGIFCPMHKTQRRLVRKRRARFHSWHIMQPGRVNNSQQVGPPTGWSSAYTAFCKGHDRAGSRERDVKRFFALHDRPTTLLSMEINDTRVFLDDVVYHST